MNRRSFLASFFAVPAALFAAMGLRRERPLAIIDLIREEQLRYSNQFKPGLGDWRAYGDFGNTSDAVMKMYLQATEKDEPPRLFCP